MKCDQRHETVYLQRRNHWLTFYGIVNHYALVGQVVGLADCKSVPFGACRFDSYLMHQIIRVESITTPLQRTRNAGSSPV